jgi:hypothetical protein
MSDQQEQQNLTVGDRLNFPYILASEWMKLNQAMVKEEGQQSDQERTEAVLSFESSIPNMFKDEEYRMERAKAVTEILLDERKLWCGRRIGSPKFKEEERINPFILKQALVNLLQRNGYLSRIIYTEKIIPEPIDYEEMEKNIENDATKN